MQGFDNLIAMGGVDPELGLWFRPFIITAMLYFKKPIDKDRMRQVAKERLFKFPRFRSKLKPPDEPVPGQCPYLEEIPIESINMEELVREITGISTEAELNDYCSKLYAENMDVELPRWRMHLINDMEDGRSLLIFAIDHALADGLTLIALLLSILDVPPQLPHTNTKRPRPRMNPLRRLGVIMSGIVTGAIGDALPADTPNKLKRLEPRSPSLNKCLLQTPGIAVNELKSVGARFSNATINETLMVIMCMALRSYFLKYEPEENRSKVLAGTVSVNFPVDLRPRGADLLSEEYFGNIFSTVQMRLPLHAEDPHEIYRLVKRRIENIGASPECIVKQKIAGFLGRSKMSKEVKSALVLDNVGHVTGMLSNVLGPREEVTFAGQPVDDIAYYALSPYGFYMGIVSYKGFVRVGICCDKACEPDPNKLSEEWADAFRRLSQAS